MTFDICDFNLTYIILHKRYIYIYIYIWMVTAVQKFIIKLVDTAVRMSNG